MAYQLPDLPYAYDALEPHISQRTLEFHHDKHHAKYVDNFNQLSEEAGMGDKSLEEVILAAFDNPSLQKLHDNAAQAWNHTFYWNCMSPEQSQPFGELANKIQSDLGGMDQLKESFKNAATTQFGSGYVWLVLDKAALKVVNTPNAVNPIVYNQFPLLTMDVWEHAYYLDYQNGRAKYTEHFVDSLVNWDFVAKQLDDAKQPA